MTSPLNPTLRWVLGVLGVVLLLVTPYLWHVSIALLWISILLIAIWAIWLMLEYLRWAKSLGKK